MHAAHFLSLQYLCHRSFVSNPQQVYLLSSVLGSFTCPFAVLPSSSKMFCKATLVTVALALLASASPLTEQRSEPIAIPLAKRSSLTKEDGTFNHDKAVLHAVRIQKSVSPSTYAR